MARLCCDSSCPYPGRSAYPAKIHIISHSLGCRLVGAVLATISTEQSPGMDPVFDQVVLAAADIDADAFRTVLAPFIQRIAKRLTVYVSAYDKALGISAQIHGQRRRLGNTRFNVDGIDLIDVSCVDGKPRLFSTSHSYYSDNTEVIRDIRAVLRGTRPNDRNLDAETLAGEGHPIWKIVRPNPEPAPQNSMPRPKTNLVVKADVKGLTPHAAAPLSITERN